MNPQLTCSQRQWLHSSVGRASHRYREVTGSNPVEVLDFFSGFFTQLLKLRFTATIIPSFLFSILFIALSWAENCFSELLNFKRFYVSMSSGTNMIERLWNLTINFHSPLPVPPYWQPHTCMKGNHSKGTNMQYSHCCFKSYDIMIMSD